MEKKPTLEIVSKQINEQIQEFTSQVDLTGFEKAYKMGQVIEFLRSNIDANYMKIIMPLQNSALGFLTDKKEGYPETVVKDCLIEAVLKGLQPYNNEFNIIAGRMYVAQNGFLSLLKKIGLKFVVSPTLKGMKPDRSSAVIEVVVKWGDRLQNIETIEFAFQAKVLASGAIWPLEVDGLMGKAKRKAYKWLYETISDIYMEDSDLDLSTQNNKIELVQNEKEPEQSDSEFLKQMISEAKDSEALALIKQNVQDSAEAELIAAYNLKCSSLKLEEKYFIK